MDVLSKLSHRFNIKLVLELNHLIVDKKGLALSQIGIKAIAIRVAAVEDMFARL